MTERFKVKIPSLTGDKERTAYVCLPEGYGSDQSRRYPVLYMFDGHNLFTDAEATYGKCWGLEEYLKKTRTPLIIAAVECNQEGYNRLSEYSPRDFDIYGRERAITERIKGKGKKYMDWLVNAFKPYIDENYATLPDRQNTAIAGSSMGGLMTLYAVCAYAKYFSRGAALSPSLWVYGGVPDFILKNVRRDCLIYTDYGSKEFRNHADQKKIFADTVSELILKGANVTARVVKDGKHSEATWEKSVPIFMRTLGFNPEN